MVEVYRVEDACGYGPYRGDNEHDYLARHNDSSRHPTPYRDGGLGYIEEDEVCAFKSMADLQRWFDEDDRAYLAKWDFKIAVYDVQEDDVRVGSRQIVFARGDIYDPVRQLELN